MTKHFKPRISRGVPGGTAGLPLVAVVGRPNVGKSTLFNRLARKKLAIVHDEPGVTRDRHYADTHAFGHEYTLVDTGGFDPEDDDPMRSGIARHVKAAIAEADVIVFVTDATLPLTAADKAAIALLRRTSKPVFYAANKADSARIDAEAYELFGEGIKKMYPVSALHGRGLAELEGDVVAAFGERAPAADTDSLTRISIVGRPNAGKSSLMNRLLGEERMMVDPRPGTTRDAIDAVVTRGDETYVFVDTAGIRKKGKVTKSEDEVESLSVLSSIRSIESSSVVVLLVDANEGVAEQDAKILGLADDRGRAMIIALNKCDLLEKDAKKRAVDLAREKISFAPFVPVVEISAKTGRGMNELFATVSAVSTAYHKRIGTGELNRFFAEVLETRPPPTQGGKTTTAAALALAAAREGRRVLCLTIDPARRLAQSLGLEEMGAEAVDVAPSVFAAAGIEVSGSLTAAMLDTKRTFDDLIVKHSSSKEKAERLLNNKLYRYISASLAGTQEYMAMEKLVEVKEDPRWDLVVLDTPPTANALDFLDAPERLIGMLDSAAMRWFQEAFESSGKFSLNFLAKGASAVLKGIAKFTGGGLLEAMAELISELNELFGGFKERARHVEKTLRSPDVAFVLVTSPSPPSIKEVLYFADRLTEANMPRGAFVVNRMRRAPAFAGKVTVENAAAGVKKHGLTLEDDAAARIFQAHEDASKMAALDARNVEAITAAATHGVPVVRVAERATDVHDVRMLASLGEVLLAGGDV